MGLIMVILIVVLILAALLFILGLWAISVVKEREK